mmetsp:Transcript_54883/g.128102  ORF Transcript_54883/g.128102 Transcript_54883/m.128102 type:complete len:494 (+) Transcript_54883:61-1542(+)
MLPYIPGLGSAAAGSDENADIMEQTEPVGSPFRAHRQALLPMRFEQMTPRTAQRCTQRAYESVAAPMAGSPMAGSPHDSHASRRSNAVFGSPVSASPTAVIEAERQWWADASERQLETLSQVVRKETTRCFAAMDQMKADLRDEIRQEVAALTDQFGALLNSMEQRVRREQQASVQAMLEVARNEASEEAGEKQTLASTSATLQAELGSIPVSPSVKSQRIDQFIDEIGLRVDGLHVKLEEQLTTALAEERKARGKGLSDVCQYIEHMVALQESDAKDEKRRVRDDVTELEGRVQVVEETIAMYLYQTQQLPDSVLDAGTSSAGSVMDMEMRPSVEMRPSISTVAPGSLDGGELSGLHSNGRPSEESTLPPNFRHFESEPVFPQGSSSSAGLTMPGFSEDMQESLKHMVRKVGDTMSKVQDTREPRLAPSPTIARAPGHYDYSPTQPMGCPVASAAGGSFPVLQSQGAYVQVQGPNSAPVTPVVQSVHVVHRQ